MSEPGSPRRLALIVNTASGRFVRGDSAALIRSIENHDTVETVWPLDETRPERISEAFGEGINGLAIAGGDGTIRSVAEMVLSSKTDCPLLPLPFGTANILVKRLYGNRDAVDLLDQAATARPRPFRPGLMNGSVFLVAAALGFPSTMARARERLREFDGPPPLLSFSKRLAASARQAFSPSIHYQTDTSGRGRKRASGIYLDLADPDAETLRFIAVKWREMGDVARMGWAFLSDPDRLPTGNIRHIRASARKPMAAMLDGEPIYTAAKVDIRRADHSLQFLSPDS
jgi:diacylglycerol kinase family enzyme